MAAEDPLVVATAAAQGFKIFQCQECAESIRNALLTAGHHGELIEIRGTWGGDFMVCLSYDGGAATITQNGRHLAMRVGNVVFDNLHTAGVPFDSWIRDFDAVGGIAIHAATAF